jgi:hypothetical protein
MNSSIGKPWHEEGQNLFEERLARATWELLMPTAQQMVHDQTKFRKVRNGERELAHA